MDSVASTCTARAPFAVTFGPQTFSSSWTLRHAFWEVSLSVQVALFLRSALTFVLQTCVTSSCRTVLMLMSQQLAALILLALLLFAALLPLPLHATLILILHAHLTVFMDLSY